MAFVSQEKKAELAPGIKAVLKKHGMKGSIGVRNHSTLVVTVTAGPLDIIGNMFDIAVTKPDSHYSRNPVKPAYLQVNEHWIEDSYNGKPAAFLLELKAAMKGTGWYDKSDIQTDYFDTAWYLDINIGKWDKPFQLTA